MVKAPNDSPISELRSILKAGDCRRNERRTKQKGIASLRCPPAPLVWLPQHSRRPAVIRPAISCELDASGVPAQFLRKTGFLRDGLGWNRRLCRRSYRSVSGIGPRLTGLLAALQRAIQAAPP